MHRRPTHTDRPTPLPPAVAVATAIVVASMAGCYRHVVGVSGTSASKVEVHEANIGRDESVWSQPRPRPVERDSATWERLPDAPKN
ncbi:MAG: hypothetical protein ACOYO7_08170 [Phycisphaerales bacterium]